MGRKRTLPAAPAVPAGPAPAAATVQQMTANTLLSADARTVVRHTTGVIRQLEQRRADAVAELRADRLSWHQIGLLMGMTGEGVRRRYG